MNGSNKVLIIVENLPVPFDRRVWQEATTLQRAGYEVSVISPMGEGAEADREEIDGIHVYRHPLATEGQSLRGYLAEYWTALRWEFRLARRVWKEHGFAVVHICNPPELLFVIGLWFKWLHGVRVIFDHHDLSPELYEAKFGHKGVVYRGLCWVEKLTFRTAHIVISTNESYREVAMTRGGKDAGDVYIVRSGPRLRDFTPLPPNRAYFQGKDYLVGYVGVIGEQEGLDYLLRAIQVLVLEHGRRDIQFMLIGDGGHLPFVKKLCTELDLHEFVEFTGRVPDEELRSRLSSCDVCVNPDPKTPFNDKSTMNKILEYMALGKPMVQFDVTEGRRSAGLASRYAKPNDERDFALHILKLLADPLLRQRMGETGRQRMREVLEWRYQAPKLLSAYQAATQK